MLRRFSVDMSPVNLDRIQEWIGQGRLDTSRPITLRELVKSRCIHGIKDGVKLLGRGSETLKTPINIIVSRASESAIAAVEAAGGSVTTRYYTASSIRNILRGKSPAYTPALVSMTPDMDPYKEPAEWTKETEMAKRYEYRLPDPTKRKDLEYYRDAAHRGYLSHLVPEGQGPSLFFRTPRQLTERKTKEKREDVKTTPKADNRIW
jgi:large subunit ribosomal protein L15